MNIRDSKEHLDKLRQMIASQDDESINYINELKSIRCKIQKDQTLSPELQKCYYWFCSALILLEEDFAPFLRIVPEIRKNSSNIPQLMGKDVSEKYDGDLYTETHRKLKSFPDERQRKFLQKSFQNTGIYNRVAKTVISNPNIHDFEKVLYRLSETEDESVKFFQKQIHRYYEFDQFMEWLENGSCSSFEEILADTLQGIEAWSDNDEYPQEIEEFMMKFKELVNLFDYDDSDSRKDLQQEIETRGVDECLQKINELTWVWIANFMAICIVLQPTKHERNIIFDYLKKREFGKDYMELWEILETSCSQNNQPPANIPDEETTVNEKNTKNVIFNEFCNKHFKDEPEYRKQKHGKPFVETPEIHVIETPQRDERSVAYDQLCEKIFPQEKDKQRFQELMGA